VFWLIKISRPQTVFSIATICLISCVALAGHAATVEAPRVKRVLVLHSLGRDFAPFSAASSRFRTELARQSVAPIEFLEVSLETGAVRRGWLGNSVCRIPPRAVRRATTGSAGAVRGAGHELSATPSRYALPEGSAASWSRRRAPSQRRETRCQCDRCRCQFRSPRYCREYSADFT
jgi:hypothetical protein